MMGLAAAVTFAPVRRTLEQRCVRCHYGRHGAMGLDVSSLAGLKRGGSRGPAVIPGNPEESAAYRMMESGGMPPQGPPVPDEEVERFRQWIAAGAQWPAGVKLKR